jgi:hypothetical protein
VQLTALMQRPVDGPTSPQRALVQSARVAHFSPSWHFRLSVAPQAVSGGGAITPAPCGPPVPGVSLAVVVTSPPSVVDATALGSPGFGAFELLAVVFELFDAVQAATQPMTERTYAERSRFMLCASAATTAPTLSLGGNLRILRRKSGAVV